MAELCNTVLIPKAQIHDLLMQLGTLCIMPYNNNVEMQGYDSKHFC